LLPNFDSFKLFANLVLNIISQFAPKSKLFQFVRAAVSTIHSQTVTGTEHWRSIGEHWSKTEMLTAAKVYKSKSVIVTFRRQSLVCNFKRGMNEIINVNKIITAYRI